MLIALAAWSLRVPYLLQQGGFQAELLLSRVPIEQALQTGDYTPEQARKLRLVAEIKAFGREQGLAASENYDTIAQHWTRTIYNVSACQPDAFEPVATWFPITGRITYLGFFRAVDAERQADRFRQRGLDVYVRTAGAYSTLGWMRDPVLPGMLDWDEARLADTLLHELTHATVWVPGSSSFNESVAQFVGNTASLRWLSSRYGDGSVEVGTELRRRRDRNHWSSMLRAVSQDLDTAYTTLESRDQRLAEKQRILASLPQRLEAAGLEDPEPHRRALAEGTWNNARFVQFATYYTGQDQFSAVLESVDGDLSRFLEEMAHLPDLDPDPYVALAIRASTP